MRTDVQMHRIVLSTPPPWQALTNLLWSLAVLRTTHCPAFVELLDRFKEVTAKWGRRGGGGDRSCS